MTAKTLTIFLAAGLIAAAGTAFAQSGGLDSGMGSGGLDSGMGSGGLDGGGAIGAPTSAAGGVRSAPLAPPSTPLPHAAGPLDAESGSNLGRSSSDSIR